MNLLWSALPTNVSPSWGPVFQPIKNGIRSKRPPWAAAVPIFRTLLISFVLARALAPLDAVGFGDSPPGPSTSLGWPQWRGPHRDGISPEPIVTWPPVRLWQVNVGSGVSSTIAFAGRVYVMGHRDGQDITSCLDGQTGKTIWISSYPSKSDQTSDVLAQPDRR